MTIYQKRAPTFQSISCSPVFKLWNVQLDMPICPLGLQPSLALKVCIGSIDSGTDDYCRVQHFYGVEIN